MLLFARRFPNWDGDGHGFLPGNAYGRSALGGVEGNGLAVDGGDAEAWGDLGIDGEVGECLSGKGVVALEVCDGLSEETVVDAGVGDFACPRRRWRWRRWRWRFGRCFGNRLGRRFV